MAEVMLQRSAAADCRGPDQRDAEPVEHTRRCGVDLRREPGCTQPASTAMRRAMPGSRPVSVELSTRVRAGGTRPAHARQQRPHGLADAHERREERPAGGDARQHEAHESLDRLPCAAAGGCCSTNSRPTSTSRPYWTPEGQAVSQARQVRQRSRCSRAVAAGRAGLHELLDQVDAAAWAVEFVAGDAIGRAGRQAEAAMHAAADQRRGFMRPAQCRRARRRCAVCIDVRTVQSPAYMRPGLQMPAGSKTRFSERCRAMTGAGSGANTSGRSRRGDCVARNNVAKPPALRAPAR